MNSIPDAFTESGVRLDLLITGWIGVALLAIAVLCVVADFVFDFDELGFVAGGMAAIFGVCVAVVWAILLVPFDGKYHHYYVVDGHVDSVSNVLTEASGDLTRQPVVNLDTVARPLVVDDPRAIDLEGQDVTLRCTIGWNYQAADSYTCTIVDFGGAR